MHAKSHGAGLNSRELHSLLHPLRKLDNHTNIGYLVRDYVTLVAIVLPAIAFLRHRAGWGLAWIWNVPICTLAVALVGAVQHRLAGLGHEAAHYIMLKNRFWNELISDIFCMAPLFATTHQYRLVHLAHHQFTNEWDRDPDLIHIGKSKLMDKFPMSRWAFVYHYYIRFFWPPVLLRYLWDVIYLSAFGKGLTALDEHSNVDDSTGSDSRIRWTSVGGIVYFFGLVAALALANQAGSGTMLIVVPAAAWLAALGAILLLPEGLFFSCAIKAEYSAKVTAAIRITVYTLLLCTLAALRYFTGENWGLYFLLLWVLPLLSTFAYFMLLRDVYQHANADEGRLTNSRVFFCDPFTRWSIFVYGMDVHIPHHMYPAIPHYRLHAAHALLMQHCPEYARNVVECEGTFANNSGRPTILSVMHTPVEETECQHTNVPAGV